MFEQFISGLVTGLNVNPIVKYAFISLIIVMIILKFSNWWVRFKNRM